MDTAFSSSAQITNFFPVAGVAAGQGGLDAILQLVSAVPENTEMSLIIMQGQSTQDPGNLSDAIAPYSSLPVTEIINTVNILPGHIYVIPQNNNLIVTGEGLALYHRTRLDKAEESFDLFFASLARVYKNAAVGIVLSGTGTDDLEGLKKLKEIGAATIAQDPRTAFFREMPQSIISADLADYVEAPDRIAPLLAKIAQGFAHTKAHETELPTGEETHELTAKILDIIYSLTDTDFMHYKQYLVRRRIAHRMVTTNKSTLHDYYAFVRHHREEQDQLFKDLLITVTGFFRDDALYNSLISDVFPRLVQNTVNNSIRIWIAGCATGQEAYSVAISLHEFLMQTDNTQIQFQIFASDLSAPSIAKARKGIYTIQDLQAMSEIRLQKYFTKRNDGYHVVDIIRDTCIFTAHNIVSDPPLAGIDLVCCQNVLPYFDEFYQKLALGAFAYALKEKGILVLGTAESLAKEQHLFENFAVDENLYIRGSATDGIGEIIIRLPENPNKQSTKDGSKTSLDNLQDIQEQLHLSKEDLTQKNKLLDSYTADLQSQNEELLIMNSELTDRQKQLSTSGDFTESILQTMHEPVVLIDNNLKIISANPAFYNYFKTAQNKTAGYSFFEIGNCQWDIADFKERIISIIRDKTVLQNYKVEAKCEGIGRKIMNVSARMLFGPEPKGIIIIALQDITALDLARDLFEAKQLELLQYNELLQTFALAARNNMLDPLQKIQMLAKRTFDNELTLSDPGSHNLERILFSAANMSKLIEDLILYSKLSFLKKEFKKTDLNLTIKKSLKDLKNILEQKKAVVKVALLPHLQVIPGQIQQLFNNIIFNAVQYSRDDVQAQINIDIGQPSTEEILKLGGNPEIPFAKITVTDNGIGFDKQHETQIFDPFFRLHNNDQFIGSGLGLTLARKIVTVHHGYINASSQINQGTAINIYIPLKLA